MRIWSLHPKYLDARGLVALWREGLLAQHVLLGETKGYKNHPQLIRFKQHSSPIKKLSNYLHFVCDEADKRGYHFDRMKITYAKNNVKTITVTAGQIDYEWMHFMRKIEKREPTLFKKFKGLTNIDAHPLFTVIDGGIESWEHINS